MVGFRSSDVQISTLQNRGGEISKLYTCPRTRGFKCTTCPYFYKYNRKCFNINDLINTLIMLSYKITSIILQQLSFNIS